MTGWLCMIQTCVSMISDFVNKKIIFWWLGGVPRDLFNFHQFPSTRPLVCASFPFEALPKWGPWSKEGTKKTTEISGATPDRQDTKDKQRKQRFLDCPKGIKWKCFGSLVFLFWPQVILIIYKWAIRDPKHRLGGVTALPVNLAVPCEACWKPWALQISEISPPQRRNFLLKMGWWNDNLNDKNKNMFFFLTKSV